MKFTWGTGILIAIITFVTAGIVFLFFAFSFDVNLVQEEYYKKGVDYQTEIDAIKRSRNFKDSVEFVQKNEKVIVIFGDNFNNIDSGLVHFFRPSDRFQDIKVLLNENNKQLFVEKEGLQKGRYKVEITWYKEGLKYYIENQLIIK